MAATLVFYNPIVHNQFIEFDDAPYILANSSVQQGVTWHTVKWAFTTFHAGYWHPLTWLSHALDCQIFGLNPAGHHYVNLLLHAINAVLLFLLLRKATGSTLASFVAGALFALHPANVESVAWAAERKNVLSMLLFLLAMLAYTKYARTGRRSLYFSVIILFVLGLMAKPQIVALPFVLLLWDYWPLQRMGTRPDAGASQLFLPTRSFRFLVLEKLPLFLLAAADSFVIVLAQRAGHAVRTAAEVPWAARLENMVVSYVRYIGIAFWPSRLAPMYPRSANPLPLWQVAAAAALLILLSLLMLRWRARRYMIVGWLWFLGTLVPMIGIVTVGEQAMADRFAYIPFIGLFVAVVWTVDALTREHRILRTWTAVGAVVAVLVSGCLTYHQLGYWHDDESLWRYTLTVTENNYMAHNNLAFALAHAGRADEAIVHFRAARALHQYPADQIVKLAHYEVRMGYPQEALEESRAALAASQDRAVEQAAFCEMGRALLGLRRYDEAERSYREALRLAPENSDALLNSGLLALRAGDSDLAVARFSRAAELDPNDVNFLLLAQALGRSGQTADADRALVQARKVSANFAESQHAVAQFLALAEIRPL
ncbi:MAG: tetratricopeptide repeat protein [Terriglobales bacterium]